MAKERFCMGCMNPLSEFSDTCYHCGYPASGQNPEGYLPVRTRLGERYVIGRALEKRGDAVIYIGYDKTEKSTVTVREFFPEGVARRVGMQVAALDGKQTAFDECMEQFRKQSRIIARLREVPALIPMYDMFEGNGTMYTVSDRVEGVPFRRHLETLGGHMKWETARPLFVPLISALISIHAAGLYHLGISPDSILVDADNRLRLDGWQLAGVRTAGGDLPTIQPKGYAAPEQYVEGDAVYQQADVYAVGATMLYALTGEEPPAATDRVNKVASLLVPTNVAQKWPTHIAPALCDSLMLNANRRIQTMEILRDRLTTAPVVEALREDAMGDETDEADAESKPKNGLKAAVAVLSVLCAAMLVAIICLAANASKEPSETPTLTTTTAVTTATKATTATTVETQPTGTQYAVENVVGLTWSEVVDRVFRGNMTVHIKGKEYSDSVPVGVIVAQDPMPETYADPDSVIEVYLSAGPAEKSLPDLLGWERDAAITYLEAMGYRVSVIEVTVSNFERGRVHAMSPAAGASMLEGDEVSLEISMVPETTAAPTTTTTAEADDET